MIEKMHDKTNSFAFKAIFALVSLSFVLGGIGSGLWKPDTSAVKVNGVEISQKVFSDNKKKRDDILNLQMGERFQDLLEDPEYVKQRNLAILNELIDNELLRQYATDLKLGISVNQIKGEIVNNPDFQQNGKFENALYQQLLRSNNISADYYAAMLQEGMLFSQLQEGIVSTQFSVPAQQDLLAKLLLQKRTARLASFSLAQEMANQTATQDEQQAYFEAHKAEFINPEKLTVEYVTITPKEVESRIQITPEQIETYYETNKAQFVTAGEAKVAHIQVADQAAANEIEQQLKNGADFAALAKEKSLDKLSATQGGDLGWAKAGTFPAAFEAAMNDLQAGQFSQPVNVDGAFHIIKVLERKAENVVPMDAVKDQIAATIRQELVATEYSNITREMANKAFESSSSLEGVAKVANLAVQKTDSFSREQIPAALNHDRVVKALFNGDLRQTGQNSDAIDVSSNGQPETIFVRVSEYKPQSNQTFDEAKAAVEQGVKREKAEKVLIAKAENEVKALQAGETAAVNFDGAKTFMFAEAQITQPVLAKTLFAMAKPTDKASYQMARNAAGDVMIVALDKVEDGNPADFKPLVPQFERADAVLLRNDLLKDLRNRANVEFNEGFLEQINNPAK